MPASEKKPRAFTFTMTEVEYNRLKVLADAAGRSMASYLRCQVNEKYEARSRRRARERRRWHEQR